MLTGDDHEQRRHAGPVRHLRGRQPGRLLGGALAVRALDLLRLPGVATAHATPRRRPIRRRLRDRAAPRARGHDYDAEAVQRLHASARPQLADLADQRWPSQPGRAAARRHQPHPLHRVERLGERAEGRARATASASTRTTTTGRARWVQNRPGHVHRLGLPDALRRRRRLADRRLPGATQLTDESGIDIASAHRGAARRRARARRLLRRLHRQHAHRHARPRGRRRDRRRGAGRGVPVVSAKQMLTWLDGRNGSSFRGLSFAGGRLRFSVAPRRGRARPPRRWCPRAPPRASADELTRNGAPVAVTPAHGQGDRLRDVRRRRGRLRGDATPASQARPQLMLAADDPSRSLLPAHRARGPGRRRGALAQARRARRARPPGRRRACGAGCRPAGACTRTSRRSCARRSTRSAARRC